MRDRILRGTILASRKVNDLQTFDAETFYRRLHSAVDDFGRFDADLVTLRGVLYPRRPDVKVESVGEWLADCLRVGLLETYTVGGETFLQVLNFNQKLKAQKSRYPAPEGRDGPCPCCGRELHGSPLSTGGLESAASDAGGPMSADKKDKNSTDQIGSDQIPLDKSDQIPLDNVPGSEVPTNEVGDDVEAQALEIYELYPRPAGKPAALKAIRAALRKHSHDLLVRTTRELRQIFLGKDMTFCPHPANWFKQERFNDHPSAWPRPSFGVGGSAVSRNSGTANEGLAWQYA